MFDENEEENEKKNQRTNGRRRLTTLSSARGDISCILIVFSNVCAHAVENDRGRLKIEPVFILMLSVYYYYIINIFNALLLLQSLRYQTTRFRYGRIQKRLPVRF